MLNTLETKMIIKYKKCELVWNNIIHDIIGVKYVE